MTKVNASHIVHKISVVLRSYNTNYQQCHPTLVHAAVWLIIWIENGVKNGVYPAVWGYFQLFKLAASYCSLWPDSNLRCSELEPKDKSTEPLPTWQCDQM